MVLNIPNRPAYFLDTVEVLLDSASPPRSDGCWEDTVVQSEPWLLPTTVLALALSGAQRVGWYISRTHNAEASAGKTAPVRLLTIALLHIHIYHLLLLNAHCTNNNRHTLPPTKTALGAVLVVLLILNPQALSYADAVITNAASALGSSILTGLHTTDAVISNLLTF